MAVPKKREGLTSIQLRPDIARMMLRLLGQGMTKTEIINEALRQYMAEKELREIRRKLVPRAQAKGIYTDTDVEDFLR